MFERSSWKKRAWRVAALYLLAALSMLVYGLQLQYTNAYMGFLPPSLTASHITVMFGLTTLLGIILPTKITKPSQMFLLIYSTFVLMSYALFGNAAYAPPAVTFVSWFVLLALPYAIIWLLSMADWTLSISFDLKPQTVLGICILFVIAGVSMAYINAGGGGGLSIADAYERRMVGRDTFQAGSALAYLNVMTMNGVNPFLAFLGGLLNRKPLAALALIFSGVFFYSIGVKAPLAFALLAYAVGIGARLGKFDIFFEVVVVATMALFAVFLIEFYISEYSEVAEYFFRRIYVIPGFDVQHYMELMFQSGDALWSPWHGVNSDLGPTYLIGLIFFKNADANVNTNAFTIALASGGFPGLMITMAVVGGFLKLLDALHARSRNAGYLYLGFLYSFLLTEQAATTALASSGVALLFVLIVLSGKGWVDKVRAVPGSGLPRNLTTSNQTA